MGEIIWLADDVVYSKEIFETKENRRRISSGGNGAMEMDDFDRSTLFNTQWRGVIILLDLTFGTNGKVTRFDT